MREKELRLALVCYGGISLAVYMHGITKEIWRVACASQAYHADTPSPADSQKVYRALFEEIEQTAGLKLRVLVDILAGASAGGINGIFLGQAVATGQSLEPLTDLWLDGADIDVLLDPAAAPKSGMSKVWAMPLAWMAARDAALDDVDPAAREEVRSKLSRFVRARWFEPPFGGAEFTNMLLDAFAAMAKGPRGPRLLPAGQPLDLFVTVTDFRGHPERLLLNSPAEVVETEHRLVFPFSDHGVPCETLADAAELAFAARATSSFPGAFPPFTVVELDKILKERGQEWESRSEFLATMLPRQTAANAAESAVLIDGSVLANAPFRPAIEALRERPARRQIDRRFVYIDPSPGMKIRLGKTAAGPPSFFQTLIGALSELPRQQPIRDNLDAIVDRSERIERMRTVIGNIRPEVDAQIEALFGRTLFLDRPTAVRLAAWRTRAQNAAADGAGYAYAAYGHLKINGVIELTTNMLYHVGGEPGPQHWQRLRAEISAAIDERNVDQLGTSFSGGASKETITFLRSHDLGFRIRRLRLLARRLVEVEDAAEHQSDFATMREAIYQSLSMYLEAKRTDRHSKLRQRVRKLRGDAAGLLDALAESMDLKALDDATDELLATALSGLHKDQRRPLLLAYLGFPYFDVATLPLLQGEGLDEFDAIKVDRISPDDARSIREGGAEATLKGIQFNSFGAFFSRAYRENDYLWGRLHGAERLIDIVVSTLPGTATLKPGRVAVIKHAAFMAILDEEEPRLKSIAPLFAALRVEIG